MKNKVTTDRILLAKIRMFDYLDNDGMLHEIDLDNDVMYRPCIFMDGDVIDLYTKRPLSHVYEDDEGYVLPEIYADTMYIEELYKYPKIDKDIYNYAQEVYEYYSEIKELKNNRKILEFPKPRLY